MARSPGFPSFDDFLAHGWWAPQNVELEGDLLHFTGSPRTAAPPDENTFARYLELAGSDQVLAFAKRFGPLFMEERTAVASGGFVFPHPATEYLEDGTEVIRERVADWCFRAASDRRLIETAKLLRGGQSVPEENWLAIEDQAFAHEWAVEDFARRGGANVEDHDDYLIRLGTALRNDRLGRQAPADPWKRIERGLFAVVGGNPFDITIAFSYRAGELTLSPASSLRTHLALRVLVAVASDRANS